MKKEQIQGEICMTLVVLQNNILSCSQDINRVPPATSERRKLLIWWLFFFFKSFLSFFLTDFSPSHWHSLCIDVLFFFNWHFVFKFIFHKTSNEYSSCSKSLNDNELMGTNLREVAHHSIALVIHAVVRTWWDAVVRICVCSNKRSFSSVCTVENGALFKRSLGAIPLAEANDNTSKQVKVQMTPVQVGDTEINTVQLLYRCLLAY